MFASTDVKEGRKPRYAGGPHGLGMLTSINTAI